MPLDCSIEPRPQRLTPCFNPLPLLTFLDMPCRLRNEQQRQYEQQEVDLGRAPAVCALMTGTSSFLAPERSTLSPPRGVPMMAAHRAPWAAPGGHVPAGGPVTTRKMTLQPRDPTHSSIGGVGSSGGRFPSVWSLEGSGLLFPGNVAGRGAGGGGALLMTEEDAARLDAGGTAEEILIRKQVGPWGGCAGENIGHRKLKTMMSQDS